MVEDDADQFLTAFSTVSRSGIATGNGPAGAVTGLLGLKQNW